jgi:outer membrane protein OmpA-like peptidoglycan-associated protein
MKIKKLFKITKFFLGFVLVSSFIISLAYPICAKNERAGLCSASFLKLGIGARSSAMGEAFIGLADDSTSLFWNPAGLATLEIEELSLHYEKWLEDLSHHTVSYAHILNDLSCFAIGLNSIFIDKLEKRRGANPSIEPEGFFKANDLSLHFAYGRRLKNNILLGIALKNIYQRIENASGCGFAFDVGAIYKIKRNLNLACLFQNIGPKMGIYKERIPLPFSFQFGLWYKISNVNICFDVRDFIDRNLSLHVGCEYNLNNLPILTKWTKDITNLKLRAGYKFCIGSHKREPFNNLTFGLGASFAGCRFDYAFVPLNEFFGNTHKISFTTNFGFVKAPQVLSLSVSPQKIYRGKGIIIKADARDRLSPESALICEIQYRSPTGTWKDIATKRYIGSAPSGNWICKLHIEKDFEVGPYDLRCRFKGKFNRCSPWKVILKAFQVKNNSPIISDKLREINIPPNTKTEIQLSEFESDKEDKDHNLTWKVLIESVDKSAIVASIIDKDRDILYLNPTKGFEGKTQITLMLTDKDGSFRTKRISIVVSKEAHAPKVELFTTLIEVKRGDSVSIISKPTFHLETSKKIKCQIQYRHAQGHWKDLKATFKGTPENGHWEAIFTPPKNAPVGTYDFRTRFITKDGKEGPYLIKSSLLKVINNPPKIDPDCDNFEVLNDRQSRIDLFRFKSDIEDAKENLSWKIDKASVNRALFNAKISGDTLIITPKPNKIGIDDITLILTDKEGAKTLKDDVTIIVKVRKKTTFVKVPERQFKKIPKFTTKYVIYFDLAKADIKSEFFKILDEVAQAIKKHKKAKVYIDGHTDNNPIHTPQFPSNWELSKARADIVCSYLAEKHKISRAIMKTDYFADTQPVASNDTEEGQAKNRRVEITIVVH